MSSFPSVFQCRSISVDLYRFNSQDAGSLELLRISLSQFLWYEDMHLSMSLFTFLSLVFYYMYHFQIFSLYKLLIGKGPSGPFKKRSLRTFSSVYFEYEENFTHDRLLSLSQLRVLSHKALNKN